MVSSVQSVFCADGSSRSPPLRVPIRSSVLTKYRHPDPICRCRVIFVCPCIAIASNAVRETYAPVTFTRKRGVTTEREPRRRARIRRSNLESRTRPGHFRRGETTTVL